MAGCADKEFLNILVLGSSNIKIAQFVKLFGAYLKYDTCKEVLFYEPHLKTEVENVKETTSSVISIGRHNFHIIDTPGLPKSYRNFKEIYNILSFFKAGCPLHGIILLIEPDKKGDENYFEQYTTHFFSGLKHFSKNILYVVLYNDSCMYDQTYKKLQTLMHIKINARVAEKSNVFHLNEDTFYELSVDNWNESVSFCRDLIDYITGTALTSSYVQCVMPPEESFLNLCYNLLDVLAEIYFWTEQNRLCDRLIYINDYIPNRTVCYGADCYTKRPLGTNSGSIKVPKICHDMCACKQSCFDVGSCSVFQTPNKNCSVCGCNISSHQQNYYNKVLSIEKPAHINHEKCIAISTLIQLFLFVKPYKSVSIGNLLSEEFYCGYAKSDVVIENFKIEFEAELKLNSKLDVTREKLMMAIYKLYEIKEVATIIPQIINENIPEGLRLEVILNSKDSKDNKSKNELQVLKAQLKNMKTENENIKIANEDIKIKYENIMGENENIKSEMNDLKTQFNQMLNFMNTNNLSSNKQNIKLQNCENLNIEEGDESSNDGNSNNS